MNPCTDSNGRDGESLGYLLGNRGWNGFKKNREGPCFFKLEGVVNNLLSPFGILALNLKSSQHGNGLRRQSNMAHYWNAGFNESLYDILNTDTPFQFDGIGSSLFHKSAGIENRILFRS